MKKQSQNKANFIKVKMNVNLYVIKEYENISRWRLRKNKPNQTQFQRQKSAAKMIDFHASRYSLVKLWTCRLKR